LSGASDRKVKLGDLLAGGVAADRQTFDLSEPAFTFGLGDPGFEVVGVLQEFWQVGGVRERMLAFVARSFARTQPNAFDWKRSATTSSRASPTLNAKAGSAKSRDFT